MLAWTAEEKGYVANPKRSAAGTVIEAHLDRKRGAVATLLVQVCGEAWGVMQRTPAAHRAEYRGAHLCARAAFITARHATNTQHKQTQLAQNGTLRVGDIVVAGASMGKVRSLNNAGGVSITEAGPSIAVQLIGLNSVPQAGESAGAGGCLVAAAAAGGCCFPAAPQLAARGRFAHSACTQLAACPVPATAQQCSRGSRSSFSPKPPQHPSFPYHTPAPR